MQNSILIIEDDDSIRDILLYSLKNEGYTVSEASNGTDGLELVKYNKFDLIILDLMLPDISGFDICKKISIEYKIPIIMLTARNDIVDKVLGLELGADDYITKPFDIREVLARVKVSLRRIEKMKEITDKDENTIRLKNNIIIFKDRHEVFKDNEMIKLKPKEYDLLLILSENRNIVFSRDKLLEKVWGFDFEGESRTVDVHVQRVRKKLDDHKENSIIETVFGVGYKML
ncbi:response regulator transcription factor [Clostridium ganghwense]|uniref:Stage 0 sporulation protein A homolog n=1 Tax=Clostridium ganghwense TaxID=312089 RepID=A0ABT4CTW8_9CLOT|nr:response regulator transcription factor [Clostridium ganghwense]MCY6371651.1 response regulator transcription factor [Clostridium ganghwense]